jgi:hypothetical protein
VLLLLLLLLLAPSHCCTVLSVHLCAAEVGGHDDDGIFEAHKTALRVMKEVHGGYLTGNVYNYFKIGSKSVVGHDGAFLTPIR